MRRAILLACLIATGCSFPFETLETRYSALYSDDDRRYDRAAARLPDQEPGGLLAVQAALLLGDNPERAANTLAAHAGPEAVHRLLGARTEANSAAVDAAIDGIDDGDGLVLRAFVKPWGSTGATRAHIRHGALDWAESRGKLADPAWGDALLLATTRGQSWSVGGDAQDDLRRRAYGKRRTRARLPASQPPTPGDDRGHVFARVAQLALRHDARRAAPALLESVGWISLLPTVSAIRAVRPDPVGTPGLATGPLGPRAAVAAALHERDEPARAALVYASLAALDSPAQARATGLALLGISAELPADMKLPDPDDKWIGKHLVLVRNADDQKFTMECVSVALNATKKNQFEMQNMLESMRWTRYQLERCLSWLETSEVIPPGWARIRGGLARSGGQRAAAVSTLLHALRSVYEARPKDPRAGFVGNFVQGGDTRDALLSATREGSLGSRFGAAVVLTTADLGVVGPAGAPLNAQGQRSGGGGGGGVTKAGKEAHMKALRGNMDLLTGIFAVLKDSEAHRSQCEKLLDSADPNVKPKVGSERHGGLVFCVKTHQRVLDWTGAWVQKLNGSNKLPPDQIEALTTECRSEAAALLAEIEAELEGKPSTWRDTWTDLYSFRELAGVE